MGREDWFVWLSGGGGGGGAMDKHTHGHGHTWIDGRVDMHRQTGRWIKDRLQLNSDTERTAWHRRGATSGTRGSRQGAVKFSLLRADDPQDNHPEFPC